MIEAKQLLMFDLPPAPESEPAQEAPLAVRAARPPGKRAKQMSLDIRLYRVSTATEIYEVRAGSPSAAKYAAFKRARAAGLYLYSGGFLAFVAGGCKVAELRKEKQA